MQLRKVTEQDKEAIRDALRQLEGLKRLLKKILDTQDVFVKLAYLLMKPEKK